MSEESCNSKTLRRYAIKARFDLLFAQTEPGRRAEEQIEHHAHMLGFQFLSAIEAQATSQGLTSIARIAGRADISPSYLTSLYRGHELPSLLTIAKLEKAFGVKFEIRLKDEQSTARRRAAGPTATED